MERLRLILLGVGLLLLIRFTLISGSGYAQNQNGTEIYRMRLDGSDLQNLSNRPGNDRFLGFSPDGEWIVFRSADDTIYRVRQDGTDQQNLSQDDTNFYFIG